MSTHANQDSNQFKMEAFMPAGIDERNARARDALALSIPDDEEKILDARNTAFQKLAIESLKFYRGYYREETPLHIICVGGNGDFVPVRDGLGPREVALGNLATATAATDGEFDEMLGPGTEWRNFGVFAALQTTPAVMEYDVDTRVVRDLLTHLGIPTALSLSDLRCVGADGLGNHHHLIQKLADAWLAADLADD